MVAITGARDNCRAERRSGGGSLEPKVAERKKRLAGPHDAESDRTRGVVATAARDDHSRQTELRRCRRRERGRRTRSLNQTRHVRTGQIAGRQHRIRPLAPRHIEPARSGGIGHVADPLAREAQTHVVLRQQHMRGTAEHLRLVPRHPEQFRRGEPRHHDVAGDGARRRLASLELEAFFGRTPVVPENGRPQRLITSIEQRCAVHLAGETHGAHPGTCSSRQREHCLYARLPPVAWILLGESRCGAIHLEGRGGLRSDDAVLIEQHRLDAGGADVYSEVQRAAPVLKSAGW